MDEVPTEILCLGGCGNVLKKTEYSRWKAEVSFRCPDCLIQIDITELRNFEVRR